MSEQKRQSSISEKEEEMSNNDDDDASEQDMKIQLSNTKIRTSQTNANAIEPVTSTDSNIVTSSSDSNFHLMTQEERDFTIKVRNAGDAFYDLVLSAIEKAKR